MNNIKDKVKAIIFDMDGTIIKTEHIWNKATQKVVYNKGITTFTGKQLNLLKNLSGIGLDKASEIIKKEFCLANTIKELTEETKLIAVKLFKQKIDFVDGFEIFHKKLQQYLIPTSIATNADSTSLYTLAKKMNFYQFFGNNMYCTNHVNNQSKPDPAIFIHAANQLNANPEECVVFEDSVAGFQAARAANMKCIAIKNNSNKNDLNLVHDAIDNYSEAEKTLSNLFLPFKS